MEKQLYYDLSSKTYKPIPGGDAFIVMKNFEEPDRLEKQCLPNLSSW